MSAGPLSLAGGEVFGRLTVIEYSHSVLRKNGKAGERVMLCRCECDETVEVRTSNLKSGNTNSCGCYQADMAIKSNLSRGSKQ